MSEKELREKKNALLEEADKVLNKAKMEKRELTDAEAQELAEIRDNVRRIVHHLDLMDDLDRMDEKKPKEEPKAGGNEEVIKTDEEIKKEKEVEETRAFENYIRGKAVHERANNLTPASGSGEALIPTTIANRIIKKVYDISPILERSQKYNVKGNLEIPYYDVSTTTITMSWATEFQELASNVGAFTTVPLGGYLAGALSLISRSLINNSQFDVVGFVVDEMAYAIKRFLENVLLNGSGSVTGLSTATNVTTTDSATEITADEVIQLKDSIKDDFQGNAIWIMNSTTRTALRLLKDDVGRYLLQDDITSPFGTTLLGKPIYVSDNMPAMSAGNKVIYYGDMRCLATKFSEEMNIEVLREKYATQHAIGVVGWVEFDSKIQDQQGIAVMKMAIA